MAYLSDAIDGERDDLHNLLDVRVERLRVKTVNLLVSFSPLQMKAQG